MLETAPTRSGRRREGRERRRGLAILVVLILLFGGTVAGFSAFYAWGTGASGPQTKVVIDIPRGDTILNSLGSIMWRAARARPALARKRFIAHF